MSLPTHPKEPRLFSLFFPFLILICSFISYSCKIFSHKIFIAAYYQKRGMKRDMKRLWNIAFVVLSLAVSLGAFLIFCSSVVYATGVAITPGLVNVTNMLRDGYAEQLIKVSSNSEENISISWSWDVNIQEIRDWVAIDPPETNFTVSVKNPRLLTLKISAPPDVPNGKYRGRIRFQTGDLGKPTSGTGTSIRTAVATEIYVTISDEETLQCNAHSLQVDNIEEGEDALVKVMVANGGNVRHTPRARIQLWAQNQEELIKTVVYEDMTILPTVTEQLAITVPARDLGSGQYWVRLSFDNCELSGDLVTFDVLEPGTLSAQGELLEVRNKPWSVVGEDIPITASFRNNGAKAVRAFFKGTIMLGNEVVEVIETENKLISPGETADFRHIFTPAKPGKYYVSGRVYYGNKQTFEKASIMNVNHGERFASPDSEGGENTSEKAPSGKSFALFNLPLVYIALIIIILALLILIKKRKQRRF